MWIERGGGITYYLEPHCNTGENCILKRLGRICRKMLFGFAVAKSPLKQKPSNQNPAKYFFVPVMLFNQFKICSSSVIERNLEHCSLLYFPYLWGSASFWDYKRDT